MKRSNLNKHFPELTKDFKLSENLNKDCDIHTFKKGEVILKDGGYVKYVPLVMSGLVKVYKEDNEGNEILLYYIKQGESCMMSATSCIQHSRSKVKAIIEEEAEIILIPAELALEYGRNYTVWNTFFFGLFSEKYEELLHVISILTFSNKEARLLDFLQKKNAMLGSTTLLMTHKEIADDLGSTREVISRLLKKLEKSNVVQLGHGKITLLK